MAEKKSKEKGLEDHGIYLFSEDVTEESCAEVIKFILEENLNKIHKKLTLIINSSGGNVDSGFALIDCMVGSKIPVITVGLGIIASMGLLIFITGKKGQRALTPNTLIMSHQWTGWAIGKQHELLAAQKQHKIIREMFLFHYKKHTGLSEKKIKKYLLPPTDVWLTAKEAKKLGICDLIREV